MLPSVEGARQVILPRGRRTRSDVPEFGMGVFAAPHLCEYAEMGNDLSGCMDRMLTENAPVKPGRPGDCLATRAGDDRGWNGARPTPFSSSTGRPVVNHAGPLRPMVLPERRAAGPEARHGPQAERGTSNDI